MRRPLLVAALIAALAAPAEAPAAPPTATRSAKKIARALAVTPKIVRRARFVRLPAQGNPAAVGREHGVAAFPRHGGSYAVLSTGDATLLQENNEQDDLSTDNEGTPYRGAALDAVVLRLDLRAPRRANCLAFSFRFLSEEYDEFVDTEFNDGFLAEMRRSTWRSDPGDPRIRAPRNFLLDRRGSAISVSGTGKFEVGPGPAFGTTYDGATRTLRATRRVRPGRRHRLFLSIFDQGDRQYDSTVLVDRLGFERRRRCPRGVR